MKTAKEVMRFGAFKRKLALVVARAKRDGVVISAERSELRGPVCCPLGAIAELRHAKVCKPDEGDAAGAWGITEKAALYFTCGFDAIRPEHSRWANENSPYFKLGQKYAKDYP